MPSPSIETRLKEANASRKRAWEVLQEIRAALALAGCKLPPVADPKCFQTEGLALRKALLEKLLTLHDASKT